MAANKCIAVALLAFLYLVQECEACKMAPKIGNTFSASAVQSTIARAPYNFLFPEQRVMDGKMYFWDQNHLYTVNKTADVS